MRRTNCNQDRNCFFKSVQVSSILIFLLCLNPQLATTYRCSLSSASSGVNKFQFGVDITKLDMLPLKFNDGNGFKQPIMDLTCEEFRRRFGVVLPDQVSTVVEIPTSWMNVKVDVLKNPSDVAKMMSANIGFDSVIKGSFCSSASYKKMVANFYNESRYIEHIVLHNNIKSADLIPQFLLKLGKYPQMFIDKFLPNEFEKGPQKYFEFIRTFGTHYFSNLKFGGSIEFYLETLKTYYHGKSDKDVKVEAKAAFHNTLKKIGAISWSVKKVNPNFMEDSNMIMRNYGGDIDLLTTKGMAKWQDTISDHPWVFGGRLAPLSDLIQNKTKKESMKIATQIYMDQAYLDSLVDILYWGWNKYPSWRAFIITSHLQKLNTLKRDKNRNQHQAILSLGAKIEKEYGVPS